MQAWMPDVLLLLLLLLLLLIIIYFFIKSFIHKINQKNEMITNMIYPNWNWSAGKRVKLNISLHNLGDVWDVF